VDVSQAFHVADEEAPLRTLQRSMEGAMKDRESDFEDQTILEERRETLHLPNFISISQDFFDVKFRNPTELRLLNKRKAALNQDETNLTLLKQRASSPNDLKWQTCPLLEARIFHCKEIDD